MGEGDGQVRPPLPLPRRRPGLPRPPQRALLLDDLRRLHGRLRRERRLRDRPARHGGGARDQPRPVAALAGRCEPDQHLRRDRGRQRLPAERAHRRPEPPRDRARDPAARADAALPPARARSPPEGAARGRTRLPAPRRAGDACARASSASPPELVLAIPTGTGSRPRSSCCRSAPSRPSSPLVLAARWDFFEQVLRSRVDVRERHVDPLRRLRLHPDVLSSNPFFGLGLNNFSVYYEFVAAGRTSARTPSTSRRSSRRGSSGRRSSLRSSSTSSGGSGGCARSGEPSARRASSRSPGG